MEDFTGRLKLTKLRLNHEGFERFVITIKVTDISIQFKSFLKNFTLIVGNYIAPNTSHITEKVGSVWFSIEAAVRSRGFCDNNFVFCNIFMNRGLEYNLHKKL